MEKQVIVDFYGEFLFETIEQLLRQAKNKLAELEIKIGLRKKVINVLIECMENIYKYTKLNTGGEYANISFVSRVVLESTGGRFLISAGNTILNSDIEKLKGKIDKVNGLDKDGLQAYYEEIINNGEISDKGGGGLGIIDIAIRSGNPIEYRFTREDDKQSFYEIRIKISDNIN